MWVSPGTQVLNGQASGSSWLRPERLQGTQRLLFSPPASHTSFTPLHILMGFLYFSIHVAKNTLLHSRDQLRLGETVLSWSQFPGPWRRLWGAELRDGGWAGHALDIQLCSRDRGRASSELPDGR